MRKIITMAAILLSMAAAAQKSVKKDSVPGVDTVYIITRSDMQMLQSLLRQNTIAYNGKLLTFDDMLQLIQNFEGKVYYLPKKEQPKK